MFDPTNEAVLPTGGREFATTQWNVVLCAQGDSSAEGSQALETICLTYYYPLYAYVRHQASSADQAQDLIQAFFERFLEKKFLRSVDPAKGKFRSFMLACLKHFLTTARVRSMAIKRGGRQTFVSFDSESAESRYLLEPETDEAPDKLYDRRWATALMEQSLQQLREEYTVHGKAKQFDKLKDFLGREPAEGEYGSIAAELRMTPNAVSVAVHRLRQRYGECVRTEVSRTVDDPSRSAEEMRYLLVLLSGR